MLSKGEAKRQRRELDRQRREMARRMDREHLAHLRAQVKEARGARKARLSAVRAQCRADREATRERVRALRKVVALELKAKIAEERAGQVQACMIRRAQGHEEAKGQTDAARAALDVERRHRRDMRRIEADNARKLRMVPKATAKQTRSQSDDEVRGNIAPELAALWERVKGRIKGGDRWSRTEAFLHYAEEHPDEALLAMEDRTEAVLRDLERQEREHRGRVRKAGGRGAGARMAAGGEVPF